MNPFLTSDPAANGYPTSPEMGATMDMVLGFPHSISDEGFGAMAARVNAASSNSRSNGSSTATGGFLGQFPQNDLTFSFGGQAQSSAVSGAGALSNDPLPRSMHTISGGMGMSISPPTGSAAQHHHQQQQSASAMGPRIPPPGSAPQHHSGSVPTAAGRSGFTPQGGHSGPSVSMVVGSPTGGPPTVMAASGSSPANNMNGFLYASAANASAAHAHAAQQHLQAIRTQLLLSSSPSSAPASARSNGGGAGSVTGVAPIHMGTSPGSLATDPAAAAVAAAAAAAAAAQHDQNAEYYGSSQHRNHSPMARSGSPGAAPGGNVPPMRPTGPGAGPVRSTSRSASPSRMAQQQGPYASAGAGSPYGGNYQNSGSGRSSSPFAQTRSGRATRSAAAAAAAATNDGAQSPGGSMAMGIHSMHIAPPVLLGAPASAGGMPGGQMSMGMGMNGGASGMPGGPARRASPAPGSVGPGRRGSPGLGAGTGSGADSMGEDDDLDLGGYNDLMDVDDDAETAGMSPEDKARLRLARKAELARASRRRKKMYVKDLEEKVKRQGMRLEDLRMQLTQANAAVANANAAAAAAAASSQGSGARGGDGSAGMSLPTDFDIESPASFAALEAERRQAHEGRLRSLKEQLAFIVDLSATTALDDAQTQQLTLAMQSVLVQAREPQGFTQLAFDRALEMAEPDLATKFALWGIDQDDDFDQAPTTSSSLWYTLMCTEVGLSTAQLAELASIRHSLRAERSELSRWLQLVHQARAGVLAHQARLNGLMDRLYCSVMTPLQMARYYVWVEKNNWCLDMLDPLGLAAQAGGDAAAIAAAASASAGALPAGGMMLGGDDMTSVASGTTEGTGPLGLSLGGTHHM